MGRSRGAQRADDGADAFLDPAEDERNLRAQASGRSTSRGVLRRVQWRGSRVPKTSAVGFGERLSALENMVDEPGETFRKINHKLTEYENEVDVADINVDDVLDAMALAITASSDENKPRRYPKIRRNLTGT